MRAPQWAGNLSREYPALTRKRLGLAPAASPRDPMERDEAVTDDDMTSDCCGWKWCHDSCKVSSGKTKTIIWKKLKCPHSHLIHFWYENMDENAFSKNTYVYTYVIHESAWRWACRFCNILFIILSSVTFLARVIALEIIASHKSAVTFSHLWVKCSAQVLWGDIHTRPWLLSACHSEQ